MARAVVCVVRHVAVLAVGCTLQAMLDRASFWRCMQGVHHGLRVACGDAKQRRVETKLAGSVVRNVSCRWLTTVCNDLVESVTDWSLELARRGAGPVQVNLPSVAINALAGLVVTPAARRIIAFAREPSPTTSLRASEPNAAK